ncbi:MAG TPA: hypothetical protein VFN62_08305 [Acidobacteriaceae bacterium]|nr:hypothetical protein [Acidobacteriaceae bacterium]
MPITKYEGITLTKKVIVLEETWLVNCVLRECVIFYSGGSFDVVNATFDSCEWKFQGAAQMTFSLMSMIGLIPAPQMAVPVQAAAGSVN